MDADTPIPDSKLVAQAIRGCEASFRSLFERYHPEIHAYAWKLCGDAAAADDIAQQTFIKVASSLPSWRPKEPFKPWIYKIALNTARDHLRAASRYRRRLEQLEAPQSRISPDFVRYERLAELLGRLSTILRETALLVFAQGLTQKEAARVLECPEGTVAWRISEVRRILRQSPAAIKETQ